MSFLDNLFNDKDEEENQKEFDVFISYASPNFDTAIEIRDHFEDNGLKCWMAPRNITPGRHWTEDIMLGIIASKILVLVYSIDSQKSKYVKSELQNAMKYNKTILTYNTDITIPKGEMEQLIGSRQWLEPQETKEETYELLLERSKKLCEKSVKEIVFPWGIRTKLRQTMEKDIISLILLIIPLTYSFAFFYMGISEKVKEWIAIGAIYFIPLPIWIYGLGGNIYNAAKVSVFVQLLIVFWILAIIFGYFIIRKEFLARKTVKKMVSEEDPLFDVYVNYFSRL